jgi:hypothetical protein
VNLENVYTNLTQIIQITRRVQGTILCSLLLVLVLTGCGSQVVDSSRVDTVVAGKSEDFRVSLSVSPFTEGVMSSGTVFTDGEFTAHTPVGEDGSWCKSSCGNGIGGNNSPNVR